MTPTCIEPQCSNLADAKRPICFWCRAKKRREANRLNSERQRERKKLREAEGLQAVKAVKAVKAIPLTSSEAREKNVKPTADTQRTYIESLRVEPHENVYRLPVLQRPKTRADCANVPRPCPWVTCRYNLYLEVTRRGIVQFTRPNKEPWEMDPKQSCVLDVAERGPLVLDNIGEILNLTRERVRQVELDALSKMKKAPALREYVSVDRSLPFDEELFTEDADDEKT